MLRKLKYVLNGVPVLMRKLVAVNLISSSRVTAKRSIHKIKCCLLPKQQNRLAPSGGFLLQLELNTSASDSRAYYRNRWQNAVNTVTGGLVFEAGFGCWWVTKSAGEIYLL